MSDQLKKIPSLVTVETVIKPRYSEHTRPLSWDERKQGIDVVRSSDGKTLRLLSDGGQSPPKTGWVILLTDGNEGAGYSWTLYSMPKVVCH